MLRPSFVPPPAIRALRDYTRARTRLTQERTRCFQRLEKLLEDALIKLSSVASKLTTDSAKDMIKAMIAGERDPRALAALARTRMKAKHDDLVEALAGMFDDHHGELAQLLLDQRLLRRPDRPADRPDHRTGRRDARRLGRGRATGPPARTPGPARTPPPCPRWPGWPRSPASAPAWPARSSPRSAWT